MALSYCLTIDGIVGDSKAVDHTGAFSIVDYNFDVSALASAAGGGGGSASKPTFSPLTVDLDLNAGLSALLGDVATGKHIDSIELQGVATDGTTVYDLKLGHVQITKYHDSNSGHDFLSFSYEQVSLTTTPQNSDGSPGTASTFSWNVTTNTNDASIPSPHIPAGDPTGGGGAQAYYLTIDGIVGDSKAVDHTGAFSIVDYNFDVSALASAAGGGGGSASKPTFSPLTVDLDLNAGLSALLGDVATGKQIDFIELQGVATDGTTVYDLKLGHVQITKYHDSNSGHDFLSFSYEQVSLTTTPQNSDGSPGTASTFSWNVTTNTNDASIPSPHIPAGDPTGGGGAQAYYLTIDGIVGDSKAVDHTGAFSIVDYNFDVSALASAAGGGGGSASKPTFSPLTVDLDLNAGLSALLGDVATGKHIDSIELQGVATDGTTVYDLKLGHVQITKYHDSNSGHDFLSFSYEQVSLTTTPQNSDGSPGTASTFSWNVTTNTNDASIPSPHIPAGDPTGGGGAQAYYLTIDGIVGDSKAVEHTGAFSIVDYNFDVSALASAAGGGGGSASKPTFSPLTVDLDLNAGLSALLGDVATGKHIDSIELQGVATDGTTVYDLKLGHVQITKYHDSNSGHDFLSFSYEQVSLTTTPQNSDGSPGTASTFSWNVTTNTNDASIPSPHIPAGDPTGGGGAQAYYLTIDGIVGDSKAVEHTGAFSIVDYNFDVSALASAAGGGGGSASKPTFSPLTVDLDLNAGLSALLGDVATGKHIDSIELQGVATDGTTVYDLKLGHVQITKYHDSNSGHDFLSFSYEQVSLTTTPQNSDGSPGTASTFSWNVTTNTNDASIPSPHIPAGDPTGGGGAQAYYLTIDGIVGDSKAVEHTGAFSIVDYNFDVSALASAAGGGGGSASKPTFSPLTVDLDLNAGLSALLGDVATGKHIDSIELQGVATDGTTVYDLKLGHVQITKYHDSNSGHDFLSFSYEQVSLTTTPQNSDGSPGTASTFSWDVARNTEGGTIPDPVPTNIPIALDDTAIATAGIGGTASGNVLDNDFDPDGDNLSVTPFSGSGAHGNLVLTADGNFNYTVTDLTGPTGSHLHDIFTYTESDGHGGTASAELDITLNRAPVAGDDAVAATTGIGGTASGNVFGNDSDPDGDNLSVTPFSGPGAHGNLTLTADGNFNYSVTDLTGPIGSHLHDIFTYTESDGHGGTASANLNITLNRAPAVADDVAGVKTGAVLTGNVLAHDTDPDGDALAIAAINGGSVGHSIVGKYGALLMNSDGSFNYAANKVSPNVQFAQDTFTFTESDGYGGSVTSSLTISIVANGQNYVAGSPGQTLDGGNGKTILDGTLGNQHLNGGNGADVLVGGPKDVLTGGNGPDIFVFKGSFGHNEITDFATADALQLEKSTFGTIADLLAHDIAADGHGGTVVTDPHNAANVIVLDHVNVNQLHASAFVLV